MYIGSNTLHVHSNPHGTRANCQNETIPIQNSITLVTRMFWNMYSSHIVFENFSGGHYIIYVCVSIFIVVIIQHHDNITYKLHHDDYSDHNVNM